MRIAIVADDLTGANDCGGQLVRYGMNVSVQINPVISEETDYDAVVFNTVSRSLPADQASAIVKKISTYIKSQPFDIIYKKIDSTMRGNIGIELNAMDEVIRPDFVMIAPGYPKNGRQIIERIHHLNGRKLHHTEVSRDPKTPVLKSDVVDLIAEQTGHSVGHLSKADLDQGEAYISQKLLSYKEQGVTYIVSDSVIEKDLEMLVNSITALPYKIVWVGSAGMMNHLPKAYQVQEKSVTKPIQLTAQPILLVMGSVSEMGRAQLQHLMDSGRASRVEVQSEKVLTDGVERRQEMERVHREASRCLSSGKNVVIVASDNMEETRETGAQLGMVPLQISDAISSILGMLTENLVEELEIKKLFLTGGDTAYQVLEHLDIQEMELVEELEPGVLLGKSNTKEMYIVTKAGNFGSDKTMENVIVKLQGGV
ncbi:four-carbon acid sugar kinase family protein [Paenibacillus sp. 8b26]|uniref:four-carbon acid sugar kinase family protein n=1 Tax=Paenibacillus sp. 8b26 TaxID=3424133 RepID=UPI003D64C957